MNTEFEVDGLDSIFRKLQNMGKEGAIIEDKSLMESVQPVLEDQENTTMFKDRTGNLRRSLKISKVKKVKGTKVVWIGDVDKKANYSWYIEWGDSKRKPRPFMRQSYDRNKNQVYQRLKEAIENNLQK
ncbi:hypothetical protein HMT_33 [Clostridium phage HM T]|uniref:Phage protein, HK97 Gp10 family n=1 Tax=Clostridium saccharoperbutylacetonicum N1-4(HMT) TaxID=931276 RepID=M1MTA9_9CLOT|nr:HK97-gp10 family putative phage morphogenesis protein [Clostridium saccharoperbutylacetonicum]AMB17445.1 hypothetical protein HMT_33 [Clostridium phage HM T]AGF54797.1 phage protein, HK97 Gp10 family [Clostridium saccharoperbutylacetonicum N1-4(HMT)]NRT58682.1 HK97 gp10 family phage protein [Clostridium saccharoperbutylacetonicum]NSB27871.1 HK97 gp10 family phage protein [Clostridium saccharoperbutylacetonicum]NSB41354.1 HK97 gp10 family phage protein [Clostridium saccharoperbutylacetonicum